MLLTESFTWGSFHRGSSTLQKMAVNGAHRAATRLHGLPFSADEVKMTVCGPTHMAFLLKSGAVFRLASKTAAGDGQANPQLSAGEQRLEGVRAQLSARRMRVKQIEAQVASAENKVFPVPAAEIQSLCDITRKPRDECETVLRKLRPRPSRLELAMHLLLGEQPENNGRPVEFWEGDEIGRLKYELTKEQESIEKDHVMMKEIQDNMDLAMSATEGVVRPAVSVGKLEEWKQQDQDDAVVAFTQLAVCATGLLALGGNGRLYRWDWRGGDDCATPAAEEPRAKELCGGDILTGDPIVQVRTYERAFVSFSPRPT
jgi:hypothetical protein